MKNEKNQTQPAIVLTPSAVEKIKSMMLKEGKEGCGLRVGVKTGGCAGFSYDLRFQTDPYENDVVTEQDGLRIFINDQSLALIRGLEIDYKETLKESGFQYRNPNAKSSCGCGLSFS